MSLKLKVDTLVNSRAWRPVLKTDRPWWDYLREYSLLEGAAIPRGFLWSPEFAKEKWEQEEGAYLQRLQALWEANRNLYDLPSDPAHESVEDIGRLYWVDHIWPRY
jgi:hypothetical protein